VWERRQRQQDHNGIGVAGCGKFHGCRFDGVLAGCDGIDLGFIECGFRIEHHQHGRRELVEPAGIRCEPPRARH
jgi:hypothetical protein